MTARARIALIVLSAFALPAFRPLSAEIVNGDTNGDETRDVSDAIYLLSHLFVGGPPPVTADCRIPAPCEGVPVIALENGDVNGDSTRDLTDAISLLNWLFLDGAEPLPTCFCKPESGCFTCPPQATCVPTDLEGGVICTSTLRTCEEVRTLYELLVHRIGRACDPNGLCHLVFGHCGVGLGGCYHAVHPTITQEHLDALAERFLELRGFEECVSGVCDCAPPPEEVFCGEEGLCTFAFPF